MGLKNDIFCGINPKEIEGRTVYYLKKNVVVDKIRVKLLMLYTLNFFM